MIRPPDPRGPVTTMHDFEAACQYLAQTARTLRLLNFRLLQLSHTNDQLLAGVQDLIAQANPALNSDAPHRS